MMYARTGLGDWLTDATSQASGGVIAGGYPAGVPAGRSFIYSTLATLGWYDTLTLTGEETVRQRIYSYLASRGYSNLNVAFTSGWTSGGIKITGQTTVPRVSGNDILRDCVAAISYAGGNAGQSTIAINTGVAGQYTGTQPIPGQYDDGQTGHGFLDFLNPAQWSAGTLFTVGGVLFLVILLKD
jgi:hypothetical protein